MSPPALVPPFTLETAQRKVKAAQDLWNSVRLSPSPSSSPISHPPSFPPSPPQMDPVKVSLACPSPPLSSPYTPPPPPADAKRPPPVPQTDTETSIWRNRDQFFSGRPAIVAFLSDKWAKEKEYRLRKRLFAFEGNRIAVQFW